MRRVISFAFCVSVMSIAAGATERVALVIGNSQYERAASLRNPVNDANDVGAALADVGFEVTTVHNANRQEILGALTHFKTKSLRASISVIYFAGHGIELAKQNYLIPTDASMQAEWQVPFETINLDYVVLAAGGARELSMVILDACRDNPFAANIQSTNGVRSIGRGLAEIEPTGNTIVAYAARAGTVALDGEKRNSPYAEAIIEALQEPRLEIGLFFRRVRDNVLDSTNRQQEPFWYGSLSSKQLYLNELDPLDEVTRDEPVAAPPPMGPDPEKEVSTDLIQKAAVLGLMEATDDPATIRALIEKYPGGTIQAVGEAKLRALLAPGEITPASLGTDEAPANLQNIPAETEDVDTPPVKLNSDLLRELQTRLAAGGFSPGLIDGLEGPRTRSAIAAFEARENMEETGAATMEILARLRRSVSDERVEEYRQAERVRRQQRVAPEPQPMPVVNETVPEIEIDVPTAEELEAARQLAAEEERRARALARQERLQKRRAKEDRGSGSSNSSGGGTPDDDDCSGIVC